VQAVGEGRLRGGAGWAGRLVCGQRDHGGGARGLFGGGGCAPAVGSARGGWERFERLERGDELVGPGARWLVGAALLGGRGRRAGRRRGGPVADAFGFGVREFAVECERLGPDDQSCASEHHDLEPHLVEGELFERELREAGVFVVADAVLDVRVLAVAALDDRESGSVWLVKIAWKRRRGSVKETCDAAGWRAKIQSAGQALSRLRAMPRQYL
jgi:hypothetical protein